MNRKVVLALGGNALGHTVAEQRAACAKAAEAIADLICDGYELVITHGNGPQVGAIQSAMNAMPLDACVAMSQAYIGYDLQNALRNEMGKRGIKKPIVNIITTVVVDPQDSAFLRPDKPVGAFYTVEQANVMMKQGALMAEDAGRGWRRVVASPRPKEVVECKAILALLERGHVVIAAGGGGIPVVRRGNDMEGVEAVVDKDFASAVLAESLGADELILLTAVEKVAIHFGTPEQQWLDAMTPDEAREYIRQKQFAPGSMLPKVSAALEFAESAPGRRALITHLNKLSAGIAGRTGTVIAR